MYTFLLVIISFFISFQTTAMEKPKPEEGGFQRGMTQAPVAATKTNPIMFSSYEAEVWNHLIIYHNSNMINENKKKTDNSNSKSTSSASNARSSKKPSRVAKRLFQD